jgi:quercetin dioxygenase-like cupin family protein
LSLVENGRSDITMGRLLKLVTFYGAHIADVLPLQEPHDPVVVRRGEQREVESPSEGMRIAVLAPEREHKMTPSLALVAPEGASAEYSRHPGDEFIYVLEGSLTIEFEGAEPIRLDEGDSAYFDSERPHGYRNSDHRPARFLTISTPPTF